MTLFNDEANVSTENVFNLANEQLRNSESQPDANQTNAEEQRVPYDRFKEVNDERKRLQDQVDAFIRMQQQAQLGNQQQTQTPQQQLPQNFQQQNSQVNQHLSQAQQELFTDAELEAFETDIVVNPKETLRKFGDAIMQRGVNAQTQRLEQTFNERFQQLTNQLVSQTLPTAIDNFKRTRFDASMAEEARVFDQFLQNIPAQQLQDPQSMENIRLAAIGYVADQRRGQQAQQQTQQASLFSELPGGRPGGFGGLSGQQTQGVTVPREAIEAGRRMGLSEKEIIAMYGAMDRTGVFR